LLQKNRKSYVIGPFAFDAEVLSLACNLLSIVIENEAAGVIICTNEMNAQYN